MNDLIQQLFGFHPTHVKQLDGYANKNYLVESLETKFIFKTYLDRAESADLLAAQNRALVFLAQRLPDATPRPLRFKNGEMIDRREMSGQKRICRALTYVEGTFLGDCLNNKLHQDDENALVESLGSFLAQLNGILDHFTDYVIQARRSVWDLSQLPLLRKDIAYIEDPQRKRHVEYFFQQYDINVAPVLHELKHSIIHGDVNEWNVLCEDTRVVGIIDFGDIVYTARIHEVAIAITYACYHSTQPLTNSVTLLRAYHARRPLDENEVTLLYHLIAARLCMSVCHSARSRVDNPNNAYASSSEDKAFAMLQRWLTINPICAENCFRAAINLPTREAVPIKDQLSYRHKFISSALSVSYNPPPALLKFRIPIYVCLRWSRLPRRIQ